MGDTHSNTPVGQSQAGDAQYPFFQIILLIGDTISFLVFAALGRSSHGKAAGLDAFFEVGKTALPFLLGWLLAAPLLGAYRVRAARSAGSDVPGEGVLSRMLSSFTARTALAWVIACPIGLALRALFLQRGIPLSFALVTFITNLLLLLSWRSIFLWLAARRSSGLQQQ